MLAFATPIVDTSALWKIVVASMAGGAGVAIAFGLLLLGLSRAEQAGSGAVKLLHYGIVALAGLFCVAAVVLGLHAMTSK